MNRRALIALLVFVALSALLFVFVPRSGNGVPHGDFDGARARADVEAQVGFGPRVPGTDGHDRLIRWALRQFELAGWRAEVQELVVNDQPVKNIIARRSDPSANQEWILLGAHYDTREFADQETDPANRLLPVPGANDGASGVAVLLELARTLGETPGRNVWIVLFDAEDNGDLPGRDWAMGSRGFVNALPSLAGGRLPDQVVIVDMIGDADLNVHLELNSDLALSTEIWAAAAELGYADRIIPVPKYSMLDDHTAFREAGMAAALLIDFDYPYWHTLADTPDKVSAESLAVIGETLLAWLKRD
jgi:hypothetical protein